MDIILLFTILAREHASLQCLAVVSRTCIAANHAVYWRLCMQKNRILKIAQKWRYNPSKKPSKWVYNNTLHHSFIDNIVDCYREKDIVQLTLFGHFHKINGLKEHFDAPFLHRNYNVYYTIMFGKLFDTITLRIYYKKNYRMFSFPINAESKLVQFIHFCKHKCAGNTIYDNYECKCSEPTLCVRDPSENISINSVIVCLS